jgi:nucleoside-diphosphate-sugar epimerase
MKVLVTGASGFLGRHVLAALHHRGIATVLAGRRSPPDSGERAFIEIDLLAATDLGALVQDSGATHLLHLAWYVEHGKYWTSTLNLRWAEATTRLVEACSHAGFQGMVLAGSCAEYDWSHGICREDATPLHPTTLYGTCKDAARRSAMEICAHHQIPCAWGRVFLPFGAGENPQRLIPALINVFKGRQPPFGIDAGASRDFLHASDVAEGFLTLLVGQAAGDYNICSGDPAQVGLVARELARLLDADPAAVLDLSAGRGGDPPLLAGDNRKLCGLGWRPLLSLQQGLEHTLREVLP